MATIHMALDAINGSFTLATGYGHIVGMALSRAGLRSQGFVAGTYAGNRISTIDHTDSGWNSDCEPGWYRTPNGVQAAHPLTQAETDLLAKKNALRNHHNQLHVWADGLQGLSRGQPPRLVAAGAAWLYYAHFASYLVGTDQLVTPFNNLSDAQIIAWANRSGMGAADVTSPFEFYQREGAITDSNDPFYDGPTGPATWVRPDNATALNLADSLHASSTTPFAAGAGVDITVVDLTTGSWIDSLTA